MEFQLQTAEHPENELKRIRHLYVTMLKRKSFRKCTVGEGCRGKIVQGHLIPRAWLRAIATQDEVYVFSPHSPPKALMDEDPDYELPMKEHVNNALTRYFTCEEHEKLFFPIDELDPDLSLLQNIHLVIYRSLLAQLWLEDFLLRCHKRLAEESPEDEMFRALAQVNAEHLQGLRYYKRVTEKCLDPERCKRCRGGPCKTIGHIKRHMQGKRGISASQFSDGTRLRVRDNSEYQTHVQSVANWGLAVLPTKRGHAALLNYFLEERAIIQSELNYIAGLQGKRLEAYISAMLLSSCEDIAISPSFWEGLGSKRQDAIRSRFRNYMPDIGVGTLEMIDKWTEERLRSHSIEQIPNPSHINLFRETKL